MRILYLAIPVLLALTSCKKSFLEKMPEDSLSPEVFYSNAANLSPGLTGIYDAIQSDAFMGNPPELDGISDNAILNTRSAELVNYSKGVVITDNTGRLAEFYLYGYQVVQRANALLDHINAPGDITPAARTAIQAEARCLRAIAYMRLVYLYNKIPLITTSVSRSQALSLQQAPREEVINFILNELKAAADQLSTAPYNNQKGRFTKQAALGFRAKVLLYEARKGNKSWSDARTAVTEAVAAAKQGGAKLYTFGDGLNGQANYENLFTEAAEDNAEILFTVKFNAAVGEGHSMHNNYGPNQANQTGRISVHGNLVNDFYGTDGLPITAPGSLYNPAAPYQNRDPRLKASIYVPGETYFFGTYTGRAGNASLETDFALRKFTYPTLNTEPKGLDAVVLRYADLLLMQAEAENEVDAGNAAAYSAINEVRGRVKMPVVTPGLDKTAFRNEVIHERRVELCFEAQRWFDLVTLGIAADKINGINELGRKFVANKQEVLPIPQSERELNKNLAQNDNY